MPRPPPPVVTPPLLTPPPPGLPEVKKTLSFANLKRLIGLQQLTKADEDDEDDEQEEGEDTEGETTHEARRREIDDDDDDEQSEDQPDEEELLWDAQAALIAHDTQRAIELYTTAALPPLRSARACLALGNLLARTSVVSPTIEPDEAESSAQGEERGWLAWLFRQSQASPVTPPADKGKGKGKGREEAANGGGGWAIRREGGRAVRDVQRMGIAGGWLVLGVGWVVQGMVDRDRLAVPPPNKEPAVQGGESEEGLVMGRRRAAGEARRGSRKSSLGPKEIQAEVRAEGSRGKSQSGESTDESTSLQTPMEGEPIGRGMARRPTPARDEMVMTELEAVKLLYDLLLPLLSLYRHGQIQSPDPAYLPPIAPQQLPSVLRPKSEAAKGRNAWALGGQVASCVMELEGGAARAGDKELDKWRKGVAVLASYILGVTSPPTLSTSHFTRVLDLHPTGLHAADVLVKYASKRLDAGKPVPYTPMTAPIPSEHQQTEADGSAYPFPKMPSPERLSPPSPAQAKMDRRRSRRMLREQQGTSSQVSSIDQDADVKRHQRHSRTASRLSTLSTYSSRSRRLLETQPSKSSLSVACIDASMAADLSAPAPSIHSHVTAVDTLRRVEQSDADLRGLLVSAAFEDDADTITSAYEGHRRAVRNGAGARLREWKMPSSASPSPPSTPHENIITIDAVLSPPKADNGDKPLRPIASSPNVPSSTPHSTPSPRQPRTAIRLSKAQSEVNLTPDAALARAEMASALTQHMRCAACDGEGVNFPECRRCGGRFCSRACRVGERGEGHGCKGLGKGSVGLGRGAAVVVGRSGMVSVGA